MSCGCNSNENCAMTLRRFHNLINEANNCYSIARQYENRCLCNLTQALRDLDRAFDCNEKGNCLEERADKLLNESKCCFDCNRDSCKCRELAEKAMHYYDLEDEALKDVHELIEKAICRLKDAKEYDEEARDYEKRYKKCVHAKDCDCNCR